MAALSNELGQFGSRMLQERGPFRTPWPLMAVAPTVLPWHPTGHSGPGGATAMAVWEMVPVALRAPFLWQLAAARSGCTARPRQHSLRLLAPIPLLHPPLVSPSRVRRLTRRSTTR